MCISASSRVSAHACTAAACDSSHATRARSRISVSSASPRDGSASAASSAASRTSTALRSASSRRWAASDTYTFGESTDRFVLASDKTADFIACGAWPRSLLAMTVPVLGGVQYSEIRAASPTLQETACENEERMDERQQHLAAAAEAMRTWIHKQRAMWAEGYPQNLLRQAQPQLAAASAVAIVSPSAFIAAPETAAADPWAPRESGPSWWQGIADRFGSMLQGTTTFVQTSWRMLAGIAVIVMVVGAVRFAWPGVKDKMSSNLATGRQAVKTQTQALSQKVGGNRPPVTTTKVSGAAKGTGQLQVESSPTGARVQIDGKDRGVTPLTIEALASGSHKVVIRGDAGSVQRTVSIAAGELLQLSESIYSGWLHVAAPV